MEEEGNEYWELTSNPRALHGSQIILAFIHEHSTNRSAPIFSASSRSALPFPQCASYFHCCGSFSHSSICLGCILLLFFPTLQPHVCSCKSSSFLEAQHRYQHLHAVSPVPQLGPISLYISSASVVCVPWQIHEAHLSHSSYFRASQNFELGGPESPQELVWLPLRWLTPHFIEIARFFFSFSVLSFLFTFLPDISTQ